MVKETIQLGLTPSPRIPFAPFNPIRTPFGSVTAPTIQLLGKAITSPGLTAGLGGVLGFLTAGPLGAVKGFGLGGLTAGAISVSPKLTKFLVQKVADPTKGGKFLGGLIEDPSQVFSKDTTLKEKVIEGAKTAGLIGAGAATAAGVAAIVKKVKGAKIPKIPDIQIPRVIQPGRISPVSVAPNLQQIPGEVQPVKEMEKPVVAAMPTINNNIDINIRTTGIRKSFKKEIVLVCQ